MTAAEAAEAAIAGLKESLCQTLDIGALHSRNPTAHKWKAPFRSLQLREVVYWRMLDLIDQAWTFHKQGHALGARILLRSALENMAIPIFLNQKMEKVLNGTLDFHDFSENTEALVLGSKNRSTPISSVNILTVLGGCEKKYEGIKHFYVRLCESAHPNYEGMSMGYTVIDHEADTVSFKNRWMEKHGGNLADDIMKCITIFLHEYDEVWCDLFNQLEKWIEQNDAQLEAAKASTL